MWQPYYVVAEKTGSVVYKIKDQLTSSVVKAHDEHLRVVNIQEWIIPIDNRLLRRAILAATVLSNESENDSGNKENKYLENK